MMTQYEIIKNLGSLVALFFYVWLAVRIFRDSRSEFNRQPSLALSSMMICCGLLFLFVSSSARLVLNPFFFLFWNLLIWPTALFGIILATLSLLDVSEKAHPSKKGTKTSWLTLFVACILLMGFAVAAFGRFGILRQGSVQADSEAWEEVSEEQTKLKNKGLLWDLKFNSDYFSEKFRYGVFFKETHWSPSAKTLKEFPDAEFALQHKNGSRFLVIPIFFTPNEPRKDIFMAAVLKALEIDINSPAIGKWESVVQNGYEGYVFDFEKKVQVVELRYRIKLLSDRFFGYLILAETAIKGPSGDAVLSEIHGQIRLEQPPKVLPKPSEFSEAEKARHEHFYQAAGEEHERLEEYAEAISFYKIAMTFVSGDQEAFQDLILKLVALGDYEAANKVLDRLLLEIPQLTERFRRIQELKGVSGSEAKYRDAIGDVLREVSEMKSLNQLKSVQLFVASLGKGDSEDDDVHREMSRDEEKNEETDSTQKTEDRRRKTSDPKLKLKTLTALRDLRGCLTPNRPLISILRIEASKPISFW